MPTITLDPKSAILPTSNSAAYSDPDGTNFSYGQLAYNDTTQQSAYYVFQMDEFYDSGAITFHFWWKAAATSGDTVWQINVLSRTDTQQFDSALGSDIYVVDTAQGTTEYLSKASVTESSPGLTPSSLVVIRVSRDADSTNDTDNMSGDAKLLNLTLEFDVIG